MSRDAHLEFRSDPRLLCAVRGFVRGYVENLGYAEARTSEVVLAVDEACANAMRHSYRGMPDGALELNLSVNDEGVEIVLRDDGEPVVEDRLHKHAKEAGTRVVNRHNVKPGGLGVWIMYKAFDEVVFRPGKERGNCVTMRLKPPTED